jgi:hypothetical protein
MSLGGSRSPSARWSTPRSSSSSRSHKRLEEVGSRGSRRAAASGDPRRDQAGRPPSFFALLVIAVSFLPVLTLQGEAAACSGRWRTPRAWPCSWRRSSPSRWIPRCASCSPASPRPVRRAGSRTPRRALRTVHRSARIRSIAGSCAGTSRRSLGRCGTNGVSSASSRF